MDVLKFGGSTFRSLDDYLRIAEYVRERRSPDKTVVVASAMAGLTEQLRGYASAIGDPLDAEASDAFVPLADTASAAMLSLALRRVGIRSVTLNAHQLGITTDARHTRARVERVDAAPLRDALERADCVVVPGAQAVTERNVPTSLGKNSSDLTAVLLAAALEVERCEIFSDARGVYSGDPDLLCDVRLIERISYARLHELALSGAKVMHHGAVQAAAATGVELICRSNAGEYGIGTVVTRSAFPEQPAVVLDMRSAVLGFATAAAAARAFSELSAFGVPATPLAGWRERTVAVTCGFFEPVPFLSARGIACEPLAGRLITEFSNAPAVRRHVADDRCAVETAQQIHDVHYRDAATARRTALGALEAV